MHHSLSPRQRKVLVGASGLGACLILVTMLVTGLPTRPTASSANASTTAANASTGAATSAKHAHTASPTLLGAVPGTQTVAISLVLRGQHADQLGATLAAINNPHSPLYHHYLSPAQYQSQFGPTAAARTTVEQFLRGAGFTLINAAASSSSPFVLAQGTAAQIAATFGTQLVTYRAADGSTYIQPSSAPHIPQALAATVSGLLGLDTRHLMHTELAPNLPQDTSGVTGLTPTQLQQAYDTTPLMHSGLDGSGVTIAIAEIDSVDLKDIAAYDQQYGISAPPVQIISVAGGSTSVSPEPALDIEVIHAIAPQAQILDYVGQSDFASLARVFSRIVSDNKAQIISISLGACEMDLGGSDGQAFINSVDSTFQQAATQGMTVLVASGDNGAYGCGDNNLSVSIPASDPNVTAVGGTALFLDSNGSYGQEAGWEGPLEQDGSGGGVSQIYSQPSWQANIPFANSQGSGARVVPDVSADADPLTGYSIYYSGGKACPPEGCLQVVGGTSAAAPLWAGLIALADQHAASAGKGPLGFINPALYSLASSGANGGSSPFHDVTLGGNLYYQCGSGWDAATGLGTPDAAVLVNDLVNGAQG